MEELPIASEGKLINEGGSEAMRHVMIGNHAGGARIAGTIRSYR